MNIFKNKTFLYILTFVLCGIIAFVLYEFFVEKHNKNLDESTSVVDDSSMINRSSSLDLLDSEKKIIVSIGEIQYEMILGDDFAVDDLLNLGDFTISMEAKDDNQLYGYLNNSLTYNPTYGGHLQKGDVLLLESNCISILYDDIDTDMSYVLLGHINNLDNLNSWMVDVSFTVN